MLEKCEHPSFKESWRWNRCLTSRNKLETASDASQALKESRHQIMLWKFFCSYLESVANGIKLKSMPLVTNCPSTFRHSMRERCMPHPNIGVVHYTVYRIYILWSTAALNCLLIITWTKCTTYDMSNLCYLWPLSIHFPNSDNWFSVILVGSDPWDTFFLTNKNILLLGQDIAIYLHRPLQGLAKTPFVNHRPRAVVLKGGHVPLA